MKEQQVKKTQITIRLPDELLAQIGKQAKWENRTRSNMIEWLLREAMKGGERKGETA